MSVRIDPVEYEVSVLPRGHVEGLTFNLRIVRRSADLWAVMLGSRCLHRNGSWDHEPIPSERTEDWLSDHRFSLDDATEKAVALAPGVVRNGIRADQLLDWLAARETNRG